MLFKSVTVILIFSICFLISSSSSTNLITFIFLVLSALKTSNDLSIGSVLIHSSFTSYLLISVWVHSELTNVLSYIFFLFDVFTFVHTLSSLSLLFLLCRITYQFKDLLCIEVHCTVLMLNF